MEVLFLSNQEITNKNNKIDLKVDSESGHHYLENPAYGWVFALWLRPISGR